MSELFEAGRAAARIGRHEAGWVPDTTPGYQGQHRLPEASNTMTTPVIYRWRITLRCGCVYRIESDPDLTKPMICGVIEPGSQHGMNMIINAERIGQ